MPISESMVSLQHMNFPKFWRIQNPPRYVCIALIVSMVYSSGRVNSQVPGPACFTFPLRFFSSSLLQKLNLSIEPSKLARCVGLCEIFCCNPWMPHVPFAHLCLTYDREYPDNPLILVARICFYIGVVLGCAKVSAWANKCGQGSQAPQIAVFARYGLKSEVRSLGLMHSFQKAHMQGP